MHRIYAPFVVLPVLLACDLEPEAVSLEQGLFVPSSDPGAPGPACVRVSATAVPDAITYGPGRLVGNACLPQAVFGGRPLVVFAHGNSYDADSYDFLGHHLASHGFYFVSIHNNGPADLVEGLDDAVGGLDIDRDRIALAGHSRGGESAILAAPQVQEDGNHEIAAVIALAPRDWSDYALSADASRALLVMYGSDDEDVSGPQTVPRASPPVSAPSSPFGLWDRAGLQSANSDPITGSRNHVHKHFIYIDDGTHISFTNALDVVTPAPLVGQKMLAAAYTLAYLRWKLDGDDDHVDYFEGPRAIPATVQATGRTFHMLWHGGRKANGILWVRSRVVDNFERPNGSGINTLGGGITNTLGAGLTTDLGWLVPSPQPSGNPLYPSPHDTAVGSIAYDDAWGTPAVGWSIPASHRDVSFFDSFTFRAGVMYESTYNTSGHDKSFDVTLTDTSGRTATVSTADYRMIPWPNHYERFGVGEFTKSHMVTVRIPLSAFQARNGSVDLGAIRTVSFSFAHDEAGHIIVDDLEFAF